MGGNIGRGAMWGGITGGVFGGVSGGIQANKLGANFLTGHRAPHAMLSTPENTINGGTSIEYGAKSVQKIYSDNFSDLSTTGETSFLTNKNGGIPFAEKGGYLMYNGDEALAITKSSIWKGGETYKIYFGKAAFASKEQLAFTLTHELGHVTLYAAGYGSLQGQMVNLPGNYGKISEGHMAIGVLEKEMIRLNNWGSLKLNYENLGADAFNSYGTRALYDKIKFLI